MDIDVANVSDDIYYDRRILRDNLDNSDSWSSSASGSRNASGNNERNHSARTLPISNKASKRNSNDSDRTNKIQNDQSSIVDVPNFRDMVVRTSDNSAELHTSPSGRTPKLHFVNTNFERKDTLDGSHLDWEGDGITVASASTFETSLEMKKQMRGEGEGAVIIVQDREVEGGQASRGRGGGRKGKGGRNRPSLNNGFTKNRRASLGLDMPIFSKVSRKSSRTFESIWGGATDEDSTIYSNSAAGSTNLKSAWHKVKAHGKMIFLCIAVTVFLFVVIIVIVTMIPVWLQSEERGESGELGGLAYGDKGDGVMMDSSSGVMTDSSDGGLVVDREGGEEAVPATASSIVVDSEGGEEAVPAPVSSIVVDSEGGEEAVPATASSKFVLSPPPSNLDYLCAQEALLEDGGYDKCVSACFPSRCCLIEESKTYKVWTLYIGANDVEEIGESISSCFNDHEDTCIRYNQACSVLGKDSLLPVKPPSTNEVLAMNNVEKLNLAEKIIQACSPAVEGGPSEGRAECQAFCETKACCFVEDDEEDETARVTDTGTDSILDTPSNSTGALTPGNSTGALDTPSNNFTGAKVIVDAPLDVEEESDTNTTENSGRNMRNIKYCGNDPQEFCVTYAGCEAFFQ